MSHVRPKKGILGLNPAPLYDHIKFAFSNSLESSCMLAKPQQVIPPIIYLYYIYILYYIIYYIILYIILYYIYICYIYVYYIYVILYICYIYILYYIYVIYIYVTNLFQISTTTHLHQECKQPMDGF